MDDRILLAFDIETTGVTEQSSILSIGAVRYDNLDHYYAEITHPSGVYCEPGAFEINKFKIQDLKRKSNLILGYPIGTLEEIDNLFSEWLKSINKEIIPIGFNVSTFDVKYAQKYLPKSYTLFAKKYDFCKTLELNNFIQGISYYEEKDFKKIKEKAKEHAKNEIIKMNLKLDVHNSLYDAHESIFVYEFLCINFLKNKRIQKPKNIEKCICLYCSKEFERKKHPKFKISPFCCLDHHIKYSDIHNIIRTKCKNCKNPFEFKKYMTSGTKFCNIKCYWEYRKKYPKKFKRNKCKE
jgi:hypothetical protein